MNCILDNDVNIEQYGDVFVVSNSCIGALSALSSQEFVAFHLFGLGPHRHDGLRLFYQQMGYEEEVARSKAIQFADRMIKEGWLRSELPQEEGEPLQAVYFTITRQCNLGCPYCYQGLMNRGNTEMSLEDADKVLDKIRKCNPDCHIALTGGEPFAHSQVLEVLDRIADKKLSVSILTNGTYINDELACRLARYPNLSRVQISMDGITEETHAITRGRNSFGKVLEGINYVVKYRLPFVLAPTVHEGNLHEIYDIAHWAISNGGWISPNNLRTFPHDANHGKLTLSNESLWEALRDLNERLLNTFGADFLAQRRSQLSPPKDCSIVSPNARFICGVGYGLLDIDWNGDVYPCHLLKDKDLIIGNVFQESFASMFERAKQKGIRVKSYETEKCSGCKFVSTCGGGCRAGAYYAYGTFRREDDLCEVNYKSHLQSTIRRVSMRLPSGGGC